MKESKITRLFMAMVMLAVAGVSFAQSARSLTLQEAIDLSIKNSGQLKISQAKIDEAVASTKEAIEKKLPDAGVSGSYLRLTSPNVSLATKPTSNTSTGQQTSGSISSATYGILNASLPIYSGHRIKYGIESANYLEEAVRLDAQSDLQGVILNTINAFDNLYKARAAVDVVKESLQGARERLKQLSNLEKNGLLARNDLLKAELQASNTELSLLDAENNFRLANINMNLMLGLPGNTELAPDASSLQSTNELKGVEEYVQLALQNRKDIASLSYRQKAAATGVKAVKGETQPGIALTGGYIAAYVPNFITITNAINLGIGVQYSISSLWKNNSKVEQAKARERQVEYNQGILADAVRLQVNQAYQNYLLSQKKIDVYKTAVAQAEENFKIVTNKYNNALATTTDVLDADVARLQARLNYTFSTSDSTVAYNKLLQTAGLLTNQSSTK